MDRKVREQKMKQGLCGTSYRVRTFRWKETGHTGEEATVGESKKIHGRPTDTAGCEQRSLAENGLEDPDSERAKCPRSGSSEGNAQGDPQPEEPSVCPTFLISLHALQTQLTNSMDSRSRS